MTFFKNDVTPIEDEEDAIVYCQKCGALIPNDGNCWYCENKALADAEWKAKIDTQEDTAALGWAGAGAEEGLRCNTMRGIIDAIKRERKLQDSTWGEQNHDDDMWAVILGEEYGEVCNAILAQPLCTVSLKSELVQVAAVAIAWLECIERRTKDSDTDALAQMREASNE
jgi:hypothetical protein